MPTAFSSPVAPCEGITSSATKKPQAGRPEERVPGPNQLEAGQTRRTTLVGHPGEVSRAGLRRGEEVR